MYRLGFPGRIVGNPALRSYDARRSHAAHLSVSLIYLREILVYLQKIKVSFYRLPSAFLPGLDEANPYTIALHQLNECESELDMLATHIESQRVRITLHLDYTIVPGSNDDDLARRSLAIIEAQALLLERLRLPSESVMVVHPGGSDKATLQRFATRYRQLSQQARARLVVEHDDTGASLGMLFWLHQQCGIPIVFDYLHYRLNNPEQLPLDIALGLALASWPVSVRPKVHLSTPRSEAHLMPAHHGQAARIVPPRRGQHADFIAASDLLHLLHATNGLPPFDLMLEAKAGDIALLQVRNEVQQMEPDLAAQLE